MKYIFLIVTVLSVNLLALAQKDDLDKGLYATIKTNKGEIFLQLYPEKAPITVANFVGLAEGDLEVFDSIEHKEPYFDGIVFHRVISDFMIQGGDPTGTGSGGPGYKFYDEADNGLEHGKGALSMANAGPNTNGSQFFITHLPTPHLNGRHTVFGQVLEGQDVVDKIAQGDTMLDVNITRVGLIYKWFYNPTKQFKKHYKKKTKAIAKAKEEKEKAEEERKKKEAELKEKYAEEEKLRLENAKKMTPEEYNKFFFEAMKKVDKKAQQTESGLVYVVDKKGKGPVPTKGDLVELHYTGKFVYGVKFDSSIDRGQPLKFGYKEMSLIKGFDEGIGLIGEGGKVTLYIPYHLAYGSRGRPPHIPPYSDLIFEIELLSVKIED